MAAATDCIFCKIAEGVIPAHRVWEDDRALAFLDINPLAAGHTLLIPKLHAADIRDIDPELAAFLFLQAPKLAKAVQQATSADGVNILQNTGAAAGQAVFHLHIHFIPRFEGDGLGYRWNAGQYGAGEVEEMLSKIQGKLG